MKLFDKKSHNTAMEVNGLIAMGLGLFTFMGWPFFRFVTYVDRKKSNSPKKNGRKLYINKAVVNHPKHKFLKEYEDSRVWCENQNMQDLYIRSVEGLKLHAYYLPAEKPERFVILCHGYRGSSFGSSAHMAEFLHENNCSLLLIDQRCCGLSEGRYITFGAREQYDVVEWINRLSEENKDKLPIYLYGQSMGATTCILAAGHYLPEEVHGVIADCGFQSMKKQIREMAANWFHLNWVELLMLRVDLFCRMFAGFSMKEADTSVALTKNTRPVLFFHGEEDTYVLPENTRENYKLCTAPKEVVMISEAKHLCSSFEAPEIYKKKLLSFFKKYDN